MTVCISITIPSAFAGLISDQPDSFTTFDNTTDELIVNVNFNTLPSTIFCFMKTDIYFIEDLNDDNSGDVNIGAFTPRFYSPISATPEIISASNSLAVSYVGEEIPCIGELKFDMSAIMNNSQNPDNYPDALLFITIYASNFQDSFEIREINIIDEVRVLYAPSRAFTDDVKDTFCAASKGNVLYIDQTGVHTYYQNNCDQYTEVLSNMTTQTTENIFESVINDLTVRIGDAGTDVTTLSLIELSSNPQSFSFGNTTVGFFYEITGSGTLNDITITIQYTDATLSNLNVIESSLVIYRFTNDDWVALPTIVDAANNSASAITPGFSTFALGGASSSSSSSSETKKGGGGCSGDCTKPTFYKNHAGLLIVKNGFEFNSNATDVINYHTPYDLITVNTNQTYNMKLKVYESNALKWFQIGFGVPEIGSPLNDAESIATFYLNWDNTLDRVDTVDKHTLVDITNSTVSIVDCGYTDSQCYELSVDYIYRDQQKNNVVYIQACDMARNCANHYINDGILVEGESLNVPLISSVTAGKGGPFYPQRAAVVELTLVDYKTDAWQDEYGYLWTSDNYKSFKIVDTVPVPIKEPDLMWNAMTRINSNFDAMKLAEIERAVLIFDSSILQKDIKPTFTIDIVGKTDKLQNPIVLENMKIEELKAKVILDKMLH